MKSGPLFAVVLLVAVIVAGGLLLLTGQKDGESDGGTGPSARVVRDEGGGAIDPGARLDAGKAADPDPVRRETSGTPVRSGVRARGSGVVRATLELQSRPLAGAKARLVTGSGSGPGELRAFGRPVSASDDERAVQSDTAGKILITGVGSGSYRLEVDHPDAPFRWRSEPFTVGDGEDQDLGVLTVPAAGGVRGQVLAAGAPVVGAKAYLRQGELAGFFDRAPPEELSAQTDAQGRFQITRLGAGTWSIAVDHPAYLRGHRPIEISAGKYVDVGTITLDRGREVRGVVVDAGGNPIAGAKVSHEHVSKAGTTELRYYADLRAVETDLQGRFELAGLPEMVRLKVVAEGFDPLVDYSVATDTPLLRIVLSPRRGVSGRVLNAEDRKVQVWLLAEPKRSGHGEREFAPRRQTGAEADGRFFFGDVQPGVYTLLADAPGFGASKPLRIRIGPDGQAGLELELESGPKVEVRVSDARGAPVSGARVRLRVEAAGGPVEAEHFREAPERSGETDAEGLVTLTGAWQGRGVLRVDHPGYLETVRENLLLRGELVQVAIQLEVGGWIEGKVVDTAGQALAGLEVKAHPKPEPQPQTGQGRVLRTRLGFGMGDVKQDRSAEDGSFRIGPFRPGTYVVGVKRAAAGEGIRFGGGSLVMFGGQEDFDAKTEAAVAAGATSRVVLRVPSPGGLGGVIRYQGSPVAGARVFAQRREQGEGLVLAGFGGEQTTTDDQGRYRFEDLRVGTWAVRAKPPKGAIATPRTDVEVREGVTTTEDIELGGGQIRGIVERAAGDSRGLQGVEVVLSEVGGAVQQQRIAVMMRSSDSGTQSGGMRLRPPDAPEPVAVARDGSFRISFVPAGKWKVRVVEAEDVELWSKEVEIQESSLQDLGVIPLQRSFPVEIKVVGLDGAPIAFGSLEALELQANGEVGQSVYRGLLRQGVVRIPGLPAGRYRVRFEGIEMPGQPKPDSQEGDLVVGNDGSVQGSELRLTR